MEEVAYHTPYGAGVLFWRDGLLAGHRLPGEGRSTGAAPVAAGGQRALVKKLESYFNGGRVDFPAADLPIDFTAWTRFEQNVAMALIAVAYGNTISYAGLATAAGYPNACRAVGNFMAKNPFPLLIPCHRVIRSDGSLGKFSAGDFWKPRLLELEGVRL